MSRLEVVQRKYTDLLADMKRLERDHQKSKKRADQLQKEKDQSRSELGKINALKDKLEKLCRELQKENKKLKVGGVAWRGVAWHRCSCVTSLTNRNRPGGQQTSERN